MRRILQCMLILSLLQVNRTDAATAPEISASFTHVSDSGSRDLFVLNPLLPAPHKKMGILKKLEYRVLAKRLKKWRAHHSAADTPKKNILSTISLILGLVGAITLFSPTLGIVALLAGPAALVTGIIALGKNYNNNNGSRAKAIIGVILGSAIIFIFILAFIWFLSGGWL